MDTPVDFYYCAALLDAEKPEFKIDSEWLINDAKKVYEYVRQHYIEYSQVCDRISLSEVLGSQFCERIPSIAPEPLAFYEDQLRKRHLSKVIAEGVRETVKLLDSKGPELAFQTLQQRIFQISQRRREMGEGSDIIADAQSRIQQYDILKELEGKLVGIPTPWPTIDKITMGWLPGELTMIAGRSGLGKTFTLLLIAYKAWLEDRRVLFISTEMNALRIGRRFDAIAAGIPFDNLRKGTLNATDEDKFKIDLQQKYKDKQPLHVFCPPTVKSMADVAVLCEDIKPDIILIDGIYLLTGESSADSKQHQRVADATKSAKWLAEKKGIPCIFTTQFNRQGGKESAKGGGDMEEIAFSYESIMTVDYAFSLFQKEDMKLNSQMVIKPIKVRESDSTENPIVTNWSFKAMDFDEIGVWDGERIRLKTDIPEIEIDPIIIS